MAKGLSDFLYRLFSLFQFLSFWRLHQILVNLLAFTCNQLIDDEKLIDRF